MRAMQIRLGVELGRLASIMCVARFLAAIVSPRATAITRQDRRNRAITDYLLSFGVPFVAMGSHIVYQPNRFLIRRDVGCSITSLMTWPTLILRTIWPLVFAMPAVCYSGDDRSKLGLPIANRASRKLIRSIGLCDIEGISVELSLGLTPL